MRVVEIADARTRVGIVPGMGGGIAFMEARLPDRSVPVLRPWAGPGAGPFGLGCILLLPFCNRIFGGGFRFGGAFHPVPPNLPGEPVPHHGGAFQQAWEVVAAGPERADLVLNDGAIGPWRYSARVSYSVENGALLARLDVTNQGPDLPFGVGFHPWFPRLRDTRLQFSASGVWLAGADSRPTDHVPLADRPGWDFSAARPLPSGLIDTAFTGWAGCARLAQRDIAVQLSAPEGLDLLQLYTPPDAPFFCAEPVSHPVNAMNMDGQPGMAALVTGATLAAHMTLGWTPASGPADVASYISAKE